MISQEVYRTVVPLLLLGCCALGCSSGSSTEEPTPAARRPAILLVSLDTTRADRLGYATDRLETPALAALAARGLRFEQAYATAPTTLPSHASMMTGLYPLQHGIHENGRRVGEDLEVLADRLSSLGYRAAAFVSGFPLASRFGLARGFHHYDDDFVEAADERRAGDTTERALAYLASHPEGPLFLWVHYFDPHEPYEPPEPFRSRYAADLYQGEIAYMDQELGRLLEAFESRFADRPIKLMVVGDHGEGLGDHGESLHGNLLYQGVMRVPLIVAGDAIATGSIETPVSIRDVFATLVGWAEGGGVAAGVLAAAPEPVLAESLKPYLQYGWQPQVMGVQGSVKVIRSGVTEVYDLQADPHEERDLAGQLQPDPELLRALGDYWRRSAAAGSRVEADLDEATRQRLAALGYVGSADRPPLRDGAPSPRDMTHLFRDLDLGSALFVRQQYEAAIPVLAHVLEADPQNLMVCLRLAVAHSLLGRQPEAETLFDRARQISPDSLDLRHYQAMHFLRFDRWPEAAVLFESVLAETPDRLPALEGMAQIRARQGDFEGAGRYLERLIALKRSPGRELASLGEMRMAVGDTAGALRAFERARALQGDAFGHFLELGVCYLADRRPAQAAESLDRVPVGHEQYPMALFKRAQASVLLREPDREDRIRRALEMADETTEPLIARERLFRDSAALRELLSSPSNLPR